ncbi:MAG: hypothetical protein E7C47_09665 [Veillonella sp.]|uniref:hypothetical protein n=1 Tax=Veillonella sp. TaxID=1926307 RepID=UPI0028FEC8E3|nr:hypothetical protein [Veillonella sp.]MDU2702394.1 hypothetical protein [Veillonella sp.]
MGELYPKLKVGDLLAIKIEHKEQIKKMYIAGVDAVEIKRRLKWYSLNSIRAYIQRNLKEYKNIHESNYKYNKEILRKTKWECSQEIGNVAFGKVNRSIYKVAANGDLIVNKKVAPIVTFDTPNRIKML